MSFAKLEKEFGTRCVWRDRDNNHILFSLTQALMDDEEGQDKINEKYEEDVDFKWCIAMGDDVPHALEIINEKMLEDKAVLSFIDEFCGRSCYDE